MSNYLERIGQDKIEDREEIEQLTARVRELEEENARLRFALADTEALELGTSERLAASQAYAEQLREALDVVSIAPLVNDCGLPKYGVSVSEMKLVQKALALPLDTSALDAYVAKRLHDMACDKGLLRIQVEELTRQRDLAVEALEKCAEKFQFYAAHHAAKHDWEKSAANQDMQRMCDEALSTIKESEAMAQGEKKGV